MRYYKNKIPELYDIVFVKINNDIEIYGYVVRVNLVEYDMIDGFIPDTEISKYKTTLTKYIETYRDREFPCMIKNITFNNQTNKYDIDLSYKRISQNDIKIYENNFKYIQNLIKILDDLYGLTENELSKNDLYKNTIYNIFDNATILNKIDTKSIYQDILKYPKKLLKNIQDDNYRHMFIEYLNNSIIIGEYELHRYFSLLILEDDAINKINNILNINNKIPFLQNKIDQCPHKNIKYSIRYIGKIPKNHKILSDDKFDGLNNIYQSTYCIITHNISEEKCKNQIQNIINIINDNIINLKYNNVFIEFEKENIIIKQNDNNYQPKLNKKMK